MLGFYNRMLGNSNTDGPSADLLPGQVSDYAVDQQAKLSAAGRSRGGLGSARPRDSSDMALEYPSETKAVV